MVGEIDATRSRARVVYRDSIAVPRDGAAQIALVGPPNAGKSSLLHALSDVRSRIGNYAFTTLRPVPALVRMDGVLVQFVEIPGLLEGLVWAMTELLSDELAGSIGVWSL